jgi:hypothetical protein
LGIW